MNGNTWLVGGGAVAAIWTVLQVLKAKFPKFVDGKEEAIALILGLVAGVGARLVKPDGWEPGYHGWISAVGAGLAAALASGIFHDKAGSPLISVLAGLVATAKPLGAPPSPEVGGVSGSTKVDPNATPVQGVPPVRPSAGLPGYVPEPPSSTPEGEM